MRKFARLDILNEALDPLFLQVPELIECSIAASARARRRDCGIDAVAPCVMGATSASIASVQDTRFGRTVLAESHEVSAIVEA